MSIDDLYTAPVPHCSFCGKSSPHVASILCNRWRKAPACICNECLDAAQQFLRDRKRPRVFRFQLPLRPLVRSEVV